MVSNLELVKRLGCYSALLFFSTEEHETMVDVSTPLAGICDEVRHGGHRYSYADRSAASRTVDKLDFLMRGIAGLAGNTYPFSIPYDRIGAREIIRAEAERVQADFVVLPSFMVHYVQTLTQRKLRVIADAIDVLSDLTSRLLASYAQGPAGKLGLYANYVASRSQERIFLPQCSEIWATSAPEAATLSAIAPGVNVVIVANSLDERTFAPDAFLADANVGFIGTYSSRPNLDAAVFLAERVFPMVIKEYPGARLKLAGANLPPENAERFRQFECVDLLGAVADSHELYRQCRVIALPVFLRGGVPLKIVEAFARGKAVVACPELVQGLPVRDGHDVLVRADADEFAKAIVSLLREDTFCRRLGQNARQTFLQNWSRSHAETGMRRSSVLAAGGRNNCANNIMTENAKTILESTAAPAELSVGIVGAGKISSRIHLPVLTACEGIRIAYLADKNSQAAMAVAASYKLNAITVPANLEELPVTDVVLLAVPVSARMAYYELFARRKTAVLAEKPLAISGVDGERICNMYPDCSLACGFQRRSFATAVLARRAVAEKWFGPLRGVEVSEGTLTTKTGIDSHFYDEVSAGGGVLMDLGCHSLDLAMYISGASAATPVEHRFVFDDGIDREIEARLTLESPDGPCPLYYFVTWLRPAKNTVDLRFDHCTVSLSCRPAEALEIRSNIDGRYAGSLTAKGAGASTVYQAFYLEWMAFLDGVRTRQASKFSARNCLPTVRAVEALYAEGKRG
jgi:predicted dehydrogenase/glycosyltransferase involved in cell wall biosynthesis